MKTAATLSMRILSVLLATFLALTGALIWASFSPSLHQFLLQSLSEQIPEVSFDHVQGSIADGLLFDFSYDDDYMSVTLTGAHLQIKPHCFLSFEVCIPSIQIDDAKLTLKESDASEDSTTATELPEISIPLLVNADRISVSKLSVQQLDKPLYQASDIQLSASAIHHRINLITFIAIDEYCNWQANGMIRLTRRYPFEASVNCSTELYPMSEVVAEAEGDLDRILVRAQTKGQLNSELDLTVQPLLDNLPMNFNLKLLTPFIYTIEESIITAPVVDISGQGDLTGMQLSLSGELNSALFPSPLRLTSNAQLSEQSLQLDDLMITLPQGQLHSQGELLFDSNIQWQVITELNKVSLQQFENTIQGDVSGTIHHSGHLMDGAIFINASLDQLNGSLFETPWEMNGDIALEDELLQLINIEVLQDKNQVRANGSLNLNGQSDLQLKLDINQFDLIIPKLAGSLKGDLKLKGTVENPILKGTLQAQQIAYDDITLSSAQAIIDIQTLIDKHNQIQLRFDDLQIAEHIIVDGLATIEGNASHHLASIRLQEKQGNQISIQCHGKFPVGTDQIDIDQWQAQCARSRIQIAFLQPAQTWELQRPFNLALKNLEQLTVSPLCYANNGSTLCTKNPASISAEGMSMLQITGNNLDLAWLQNWLPADTTLQGTTNLKANIKALPKLSIAASATSNDSQVILFDNSPETMKLDINSTVLAADLTAESLRLTWQVHSSNGNSNGNIALQNEQLSGELLVDGFKVAPFSHWLLVEEGDHLQGTLSGNFSLGGSLASPALTGQANLQQGEIHTAMLPLPITDISVSLTTENRIASLQGSFLASDKPGQLQGTFNWQQEAWWSKVSFQSDTLAYRPEENILIYLKPNITFNLTPTTLSISGEVHVPKARIHLKSLPEQAITVSPDTEIVGNDAETGAELQISSNLNLSLGDDVRFKGYGLETDITGQMSISQHRSDLMQSKGIIRLKNGTYQAYGQSLSITDGDLIFIDDLENPQLRLSATRDNISDNVVVGIRVTGRARSPEINIFSIPEMPQQEKFYYLISGRAPNTNSSQDSSSVAAEAAVSMALEARSGSLTRKAGKTLGIQDLTLSTGSTENRSEVGLSGYITPDLMIRYGVGMFEAVNTLTLKYRIRKNLYAEVISGKSNAFDLLWSFDRD